MFIINLVEIKLNVQHVMIMVVSHVLIYREYNLHNVTVLLMNMGIIKIVLHVLINVNKIVVIYLVAYNVLILQEVNLQIVYAQHMKCMEIQVVLFVN